MHFGLSCLLSVINVCGKWRSFLKIISSLLCVFPFLTDLSDMVRQVNTVLCSEVGSYSTTHWCLYDQSVPPTGKVLVLWQTCALSFYTEGKKKVPCFNWRCCNSIVILCLFLDFRNLWWDNTLCGVRWVQRRLSTVFNGSNSLAEKGIV